MGRSSFYLGGSAIVFDWVVQLESHTAVNMLSDMYFGMTIAVFFLILHLCTTRSVNMALGEFFLIAIQYVAQYIRRLTVSIFTGMVPFSA